MEDATQPQLGDRTDSTYNKDSLNPSEARGKRCCFMEAETMRHHDRNLAGRWRKIALEGALIGLGLTACLPDGRAQMIYKGGFNQTRRERENPPPQQAARPAMPQTIASYFPDNDFTYPSYYSGEGPQRPQSSSASLPLYRISPSALPWNQAGFADDDEPLQAPAIPRSPSRKNIP